MKPLEKTSNDLFQHLRTRFSPVTIGDENAEVTTDPMAARFFSFVYEENGEARGTVSVSIISNRSLKVYFSHDMVESIVNSNDWYGFLKELRFFAKQNLLSFDARDIQKDQLDTRDFEFIKKNDFLKLFSQDKTENNGSKKFIATTYDKIYMLSKNKKSNS